MIEKYSVDIKSLRCRHAALDFIFGFRWLGHFNLLFWVDIIGLDTDIFFIFRRKPWRESVLVFGTVKDVERL